LKLSITLVGDISTTLLGNSDLVMETQTSQPEKQSAPSPAATSCRRKKNEQATFLEDVKDHIDEFINASMDEHKTCFKKTIQKMFSMSKVVAEKSAETKEEVESSLPLRTVDGEK
jgi:hypothetical protein